MRVAVLAGVGIIVAALFVVPVPTTVRRASRLVPLPTPQVTVQLEGRAATEINGAYLHFAQQPQPSAVRALVAGLRPDETLHGPATLSDVPQQQPVNMGALLGLGLSPARMQGTAMPVQVTTDESVDPASVASALQAFDVTAPQDAAAGRTILAIGRVAPDQSLVCDVGLDDMLASAREQRVDLVLVPTACGGPRAGGQVVAVASLGDAVTALLEARGG